MTERNPDDDVARPAAVLLSIDRALVPDPTVESLVIEGKRAVVRFVGGDGSASLVRLKRRGGRWQVAAVEAA